MVYLKFSLVFKATTVFSLESVWVRVR